MKRKSPARRTRMARIAVDYPQEGERITSPRYRFHIEGPEGPVEIAIDGAPWVSCRGGNGFWWYDWSGYESGRHQASVRGETRDGRDAAPSTRRFVVEL
jgi:hypothetical protein